MGRKPLAREVQKRRGAYKKDPQRENKKSPLADGSQPKMPEWLEGPAKEKWIQLAEDLGRMGVLSRECRELMVAYCEAYAGYMEVKKNVAEFGLFHYDDKGNPRRNPNLNDLHKFRDAMTKLLPEFGLTPSSRSKLISFKENEEEDPFAVIMDRLAGTN